MSSKLTALLAERRTPAADDRVDVDRMRSERHALLQVEMARQQVDVAVLLHAANVGYATGLLPRAIDITHGARSVLFRCALVSARSTRGW